MAFKYQKRPDDLMLLRVLEDVVYTAFKGKARRLIRYLRSDLPFEELEQYRELLADLIERKVQRKGRGQRGKAVPTLTGDLEKKIIAFCQSRLDQQRTLGPLPRGAIDAATEAARSYFAEDDLSPVKWENIKKALLRGPASTKRK